MTNNIKRVGLAVMRGQPFHLGHLDTINKMIQTCEEAIVCLGSTQLSRVRHNPFTFDERVLMLRNVYGDRLKIVPLKDLGATQKNNWINYIEDKLEKLGMDNPTDYYTGSAQDSIWYNDHFCYNWSNIRLTSKSDMKMHEKFINDDGIIRRLHINNRNDNPVPSATEIRGFLEMRSSGWKEWTPQVNHELIESVYPEELKIPV